MDAFGINFSETEVGLSSLSRKGDTSKTYLSAIFVRTPTKSTKGPVCVEFSKMMLDSSSDLALFN